MKLRSIPLIPLFVVFFVSLSGCCLDPKKLYPGPEFPKKDLALIIQKIIWSCIPFTCLLLVRYSCRDRMKLSDMVRALFT